MGAFTGMCDWLAAGVGALGGIAVMLDLGGRLFGSYRRTLWAAAWRVLVVAMAGALLLGPLCLMLAGYLRAGLWAWVAAPLGLLAVAALLRPARHGIARVAGPDCPRTEEALGPRLCLVRSELTMEPLPPGLAGLRLLVLSDLHCTSTASLSFLERYLDALAEREPDLVLILGDLGGKPDLLPGIVSWLASVPARIGSFCVRGNHDFDGGRASLIAGLLADTHIRLLDNRGWTSEGVTVTGVEAPWNTAAPPEGLGSGLRIVLSHTPDNVFALERLGAHLILSGHTHGGHLHVPGLGPLLVPSRYGTLLAHGAFRLRQTTLYVTPGLGYFPGGRWAKGEITEISLRPQG